MKEHFVALRRNCNKLSAAKRNGQGEDKYWGIILPVMITYLVTVLGSMITAYIFMKQALDRTADSRRYFENVVEQYRQKIMKRLVTYLCDTEKELLEIGRCLTIAADTQRPCSPPPS